MHRVALTDSFHLHARNFPSLFKCLEKANITPTVFLDRDNESWGLIQATGNYAALDERVSPFIARSIRTEAEVFAARDADALYATEVANLRLWPLCRSEALAYLLTGNGLKQANQKEGANIAGAALSLGVSKSEPLLQQLGDRLGLDELSVESDRGIEESSLILGKYLNPDLYLGYSQGLFTPEGAVLLRLKLSERLHVESRSGSEQSVDLFYRLEHD